MSSPVTAKVETIPTPVKQKRAPRPALPKKAFAALQFLDESGKPVVISKDRIRLLAISYSAEEILTLLEGNENAFYVGTMVKPQRQVRTAG